MNEKYVVSSLGPIDRLAPGTDVTERYGAALLARLVDEGYVEIVTPKPKRKAKADAAPEAAEGDKVTDGS